MSRRVPWIGGNPLDPYALQRGVSLQFLFRFCLAPMRLGPSNCDSLVVSSPAIIVLETLKASVWV